MNSPTGKTVKTLLIIFGSGLFIIVLIAGIVVAETLGRTVIQVDIRQNIDIIHLSTFGEPPQFAIWLEEPITGDLKTIFVTYRVAVGDWEGKADVPNALPRWTSLFRDDDAKQDRTGKAERSDLVITGATPRQDFFSVRAEVDPGSEWICWIEMNLAGDFNEAFPEYDIATSYEDEYSRGQPSLVYRAELSAVRSVTLSPSLYAQSVLENGNTRLEPVSKGVTTAKQVFDTILISVMRPKPRIINKPVRLSY